MNGCIVKAVLHLHPFFPFTLPSLGATDFFAFFTAGSRTLSTHSSAVGPRASFPRCTSSNMSAPMLPPGQPKIDLLPALCNWLWEGHRVTQLFVSDSNKYYWTMPKCSKGHLRLMTIQAAKNQLNAPKNKGNKTLFPCERCSVGHYEGILGPQTCPEDIRRSKFEQWCWLNLQRVLAHEHVVQHMLHVLPGPYQALVGPTLGYVVECKAVPGWNACVDIFVPALSLAIQVDGEHHSKPSQMATDKNFMSKAQQHGIHAFRVSCDDDTRHTYNLLWQAINMCMQHKPGQPSISMYSPKHPIMMEAARSVQDV